MDKPKKRPSISVTIGDKQKKQERKELEIKEWEKGSVESAAAAEPEKDEDEFEWIFPEEVEQKEEAITQYVPKQSTSSRRGIAKWIIIIASAVLIGLLLGYTMLKVVIQERGEQPQAVLKEENASDGSSSADVPAAEKPAAQSLSPIEASVVQGGIFSTEEAAAAMKSEITAKDIPAEVILQDGQYIVWLAVAATLDTAKMIGEAYEEGGAAVYAKQASISPSSELQSSAAELASLFPKVAEASGRRAAGRDVDSAELSALEKELGEVKVPEGDQAAAELKQLLTASLDELKGNQPQDAKAAQEKLLAFLSIYSQ